MKKWLLFILWIGVFSVAQAQIRETPKFNRDSLEKEARNLKTVVIKTNPLNFFYGPLLITGEYRLGAEIQTNRKQSFNLAASYLGKGRLFRQFLDTTVAVPSDLILNGYRIQAGYRFYFGHNFFHAVGLSAYKTGIIGFFIGPNASLVNFKVTTRTANQFDNYLNFQLIDATLDGGMQLRFDRVYGDIFLGLGYKENTQYLVTPTGSQNLANSLDPDDFIFNSNFKVRGGFNIGISF